MDAPETTDVTETLVSAINSWDCDENDHLNVQGYFGLFDAAARHFRAITGKGDPTGSEHVVRHVRYHSELRPAEPIKIESHIANGPFGTTLVHRMIALKNRRLTATAIDGLGIPFDSATPIPDDVQPKGIALGLAALVRPDQKRATVTNRSIVSPWECGPDGRITDRFFIARFSDAAPHIWDYAGLTTTWLNAYNFGRVAVEIRLTPGDRLRAGDLVVVESEITAIGNRTFSLRHTVIEPKTEKIAAVGDAVALAMDLETRKAVAIPDEIRRVAQSRIAG